jgi:hypothetical protein
MCAMLLQHIPKTSNQVDAIPALAATRAVNAKQAAHVDTGSWQCSAQQINLAASATIHCTVDSDAIPWGFSVVCGTLHRGGSTMHPTKHFCWQRQCAVTAPNNAQAVQHLLPAG